MKNRLTLPIAVLLAMAIAAPLAFATGSQESAAPQEPVTIKILYNNAGAVYTSKVLDWANNPYAQELSRLSGYNLLYEFGSNVGYNQFLTVRFASGDLPDIVRTDDVDSATAHPGAVDQGVFTEMGPYIEKYGPAIKKNIPDALWNSPRVSKNGKIYAIPTTVPYTSSRIVYIRRDWLDEAGMQTPKTVDDFLKFYEWAKVNKNAYGYFVRENMAYGELFFQAIGGVNANTWSYRDGQFVPDMITSDMKEVVRFWKMLYEKSYVNPNLFTMKSSEWPSHIYQGQAATWLHAVPNYHYSWTDLMLDKNAKIDMIAAPEGPKGKLLIAGGDRFHFAMVFPTKSKVVTDSVKFINWAWESEEAQTFFTWGIKDVNYTVDNSGKISYDPQAPRNKTDNEYQVYRLSLNPTVFASDTPQILATLPDPEVFLNGYKVAEAHSYPNPAAYMPAIAVFKTSPELNPGFDSGTLFLEMFAKAISGKEDLDKSFDAFVAEWRKRGGDEAIKIATEWYRKFNKIP